MDAWFVVSLIILSISVLICLIYLPQYIRFHRNKTENEICILIICDLIYLSFIFSLSLLVYCEFQYEIDREEVANLPLLSIQEVKETVDRDGDVKIFVRGERNGKTFHYDLGFMNPTAAPKVGSCVKLKLERWKKYRLVKEED